MTATANERGMIPLVSMRGITKRFPNVTANDSVDLDLFPGEVHALLGENGAGKSTLMKILYGFYSADSGTIALNGQEVQISSPMEARKHNIGMVFQTFTLISAMTVAENISLYLPDLPSILDPKQIAGRIKDLGARYQLDVNPSLHVRDLPLGDQQKVEVLKLLLGDAKVLIFDEATRVLAPHEIDNLFQIFESLKADGYAIVLITHKMREVIQCADRISVLRQGRLVKTITKSEATEAALVSMMFGEQASEGVERQERTTRPGTTSVLELKDLTTPPSEVATQLKNINLHIRAGEILGVAGVSGNGQSELVDTILGFLPIVEGTREIQGVDTTNWKPSRIRQRGIGYIPEDALQMGVVPWMNIIQNTALGNPDAYALYGGLAMDWDRVKEDVRDSFESLSFEPLNQYVPVRSFSGGQLQRSVLAREIARDPQLIVASYPTRGLDVQSQGAVFSVFEKLRDDGRAILLVSEDLDELYRYCDRMIVLYQGKIVGTFRPDEIDRHSLGCLMTGAESIDNATERS